LAKPLFPPLESATAFLVPDNVVMREAGIKGR